MAEARRKTSIEERKEIVKYCIEHNRNYKETASVYDVSYSQVYSWVKKYDARGEEGLTDKRGHHKTDEEVEGVMKVSFDLDDTLFVSPENFKTEVELKFPFNRIYKEHLRLGTIDLMNWIQEQGIELWVYTTSFRSERYIRALFRCYGIKLDAVVNGERHAREVQADKKEAMPSKYPGKYRIDLHIDDDISVVQNGRVYGFKVFLIGSQDDQWTDKIKQEIKNIIEIKFKGRK